MKKFRTLDYLKRYSIAIIAMAILAGAAFYVYMQYKQGYTAAVVINYSNNGAAEGYAPDSSQIDTTEISSPSVITRALAKMGLSADNYNLDELRARFSVTELYTDQEQAVQKSKNSMGEAVTTKATRFLVTFTAKNKDSDSPKKFAQQLLDNMITIYLKDYGQNHVYNIASPNVISDLTERNYDYLEMAEILDDSITTTINDISSLFDVGGTFRSVKTGYSFSDLYREFAMLKQVELSNLYSYILNNKVTKNVDVLLAKYEDRIQNYYRENDAIKTQLVAINNVTEAYVRMMRESGNTNITAEYILNNIWDVWDESYNFNDQTVEYDVLMKSYVSNRENYEWALVDVEYCEFIKDIYSGNDGISGSVEVEEFVPRNNKVTPAGASTSEAPETSGTASASSSTSGGTKIIFSSAKNTTGRTNTRTSVSTAGTSETSTSKTGTAKTATSKTSASQEKSSIKELASSKPSVDITPVILSARASSSEEAVRNTTSLLDALLNRTNYLYGILTDTTNEFHELSGAANINVPTNVVVYEDQQVLIYAAIVIVIALVILCVVVILLGRVADIIDDYTYRNKELDLPNKAGCEKYLATYENQVLPESFGVVMLQLTEVNDKTVRYGFAPVEEMSARFAALVKENFPNGNGSFLGINSNGQFMACMTNGSEDRLRMCTESLKHSVMDYNASAECKISYDVGFADTDTAGVYRIRRLLVHALHNMHPAFEAKKVTE